MYTTEQQRTKAGGEVEEDPAGVAHDTVIKDVQHHDAIHDVEYSHALGAVRVQVHLV